MAVLHKTRNQVLPSTYLGNFPMRACVFPGCKMAASTDYKHRVLGVIISPIQLPACNGENLIPLVIIVSMCEVFSPERRCTRHALQKHYTNRQIFKKI